MENKNIKAKNHYVPRALLKPWRWKQDSNNLHARYWDDGRGKLDCKRLGVDGFCYKRDLLTTDHPTGRSDALENFFETIDNAGARVRDQMLRIGLSHLTRQDRNDFTRLLMPLEQRRPNWVNRVRKSPQEIFDTLNNDQELRDLMTKAGISGTPSGYIQNRKPDINIFEESFESSLIDCANSQRVGSIICDARWGLRKLAGDSLVLSDRPLIRINGIFQSEKPWLFALPLAPDLFFFATNSAPTLNTVYASADDRVLMLANKSSAAQAEKYLFVADDSHDDWIANALSKARERL